MKRTAGARILSMLLCVVMVFTALPFFASARIREAVYVLVGSDFQEGSHEGSASIVSSICGAIKDAGYESVNGFLFAGDYDRNTVGSLTETQKGIQALDATVSEAFPSISHKVFVQGNHDAADAAGLSQSGANDCADYGVYVIHNNDYMWYNSDEATIRNTASALHEYLINKEQAGYTKPIFVTAHLPLHYSMRTVNDGDAQYANYIFDELNDAGAMGLNIVYLYGHDHSHGWDNYLGGSAICLLPGDSINIAQASRTVFAQETLNFTYMNAGYTGYYSSNNGTDDALTMCLFEIRGDSLIIHRFDASGEHSLKSAGTYNIEYDDRSLLPSNVTVYASPQTVALSQNVLERGWFEDDAFGVAAYFTGSGIEVSDLQDDEVLAAFGGGNYAQYVTYTIEPVGENIGKADLAVPYDEFGTENVRLYLKTGDGFVRQNPEKRDGRMYISVYLPATVVLALSDNPYENNAFSALLWRAVDADGAFRFLNLEKDLYLGCGSNATVDSVGARLTVTEMTGGFKLALAEATGSKAAGDALHFGTANRCSFGDASAFNFYEYVEDDLYRLSEAPEYGKIYLIVYKSGSSAYLLTAVPNSDRLETEQRDIPLVGGEQQEDPYAELLYLAGGSEGAYTFFHTQTGLYLSCSGNATLAETPATFTVTKAADGVTIALAASIGGKSAGDALHFGTGGRISFGTATTFRLYEAASDNLFIERDCVTAGKSYLIASLSGGSLFALSGSVYSSGSSSRIETCVTEISLTDADREAFRDSAFLPMLYKAVASDTAFTLKNVNSGQYLGCEGNATLSAEPAKFVFTGSSGALTAVLSEAIGGKAAGDALHLGSGNRVSFGTASPVTLYEYAGGDLFTEVSAPQDGRFYLIVFAGGYALNDNVYNPGASSRMETTQVDVPLYDPAERFNINGVGGVDVRDVTFLLNFIAGVGLNPAVGKSADLNSDGEATVVDVTVLLNFIARIGN